MYESLKRIITCTVQKFEMNMSTGSIELLYESE